MTKQYSFKTQDYINDHIPDAILDEGDELNDIKQLAGVGNKGSLTEYAGYGSLNRTDGSNTSITAVEKIAYQNDNDVKPGSPEWFRLWFSKPGMTGESPF